jgi:hypothetical protein
MSSISSNSVLVADFSGLGVGCVVWGGGTLLKKDVMGLCWTFGFPGDLDGDFSAARNVCVFGDAARCVCEVLLRLISVPLLGRLGGGGESRPLSSSADNTTALGRVGPRYDPPEACICDWTAAKNDNLPRIPFEVEAA